MNKEVFTENKFILIHNEDYSVFKYTYAKIGDTLISNNKTLLKFDTLDELKNKVSELKGPDYYDQNPIPTIKFS